MSTCCPQGFTYNAVTGKCEQVSSTLATLTGTPTPLIKGQCIGYGNLGAVFYADISTLPKPITASNNSVNPPNPVDFFNYAVLVDGVSAVLPIQTAVATTPSQLTWGFPYPPPTPLPPLCSGRLNEAGIWVNNLTLREWIGITTCVNIPQTKTYYIGIAGDDVVKLTINGQLVLDLQGAGWNFTTWKVFPITLNAGNNIFLLEGLTAGGNASMAFEIYDATLNQLTAVPNNIALAPYILFSSISLIGQNITNGTTIGYQCSPGCSLNVCNLPFTCDCITSVAPEACCYTLTNCVTGVEINTQSDISIYLGKIVKIDTTENCWIVSQSQVACPAPTPVTVLSQYDNCDTCVKKCYKLVDCEGINPDLLVDNDLSNYLGQVIKIQSCPDVCWTVLESDTCTGSKTITLTESFTSCNICLKIFEPPVLLKNRSVMPNYGEGKNNCSLEYIEKVNCNFSEQLYTKMISKKYGLKSCEEPNYTKWGIKKQLLDLNLIEDPYACTTPPADVVCDAPVEPQPPTPTPCPAPSDVEVTFSYIVNCDPPTNVVATFSYDNPVGNL